MGPYCNFCNQRCFCVLPEFTPRWIRDQYPQHIIVATCYRGQQAEKKQFGYCYQDIVKEIEVLLARGTQVATDTCHLDEFWDANVTEIMVKLFINYLGDNVTKEYVMQELHRAGCSNFDVVAIFRPLEEYKREPTKA